MKISVTAEHINRGSPRSAKCCPVALAIREKLGPDRSVLVRHSRVSINDVELWLPIEAQEFIENFDESKPVKPFDFPLGPSRAMSPNMIRRAWLDDIVEALRGALGFIRFLALVLIERRQPRRG